MLYEKVNIPPSHDAKQYSSYSLLTVKVRALEMKHLNDM